MQTEDELVNPWLELRRGEVRNSAGEQLLRHPNMNTIGRLPGFGMFHIGMSVCEVSRPVVSEKQSDEIISLDIFPV